MCHSPRRLGARGVKRRARARDACRCLVTRSGHRRARCRAKLERVPRIRRIECATVCPAHTASSALRKRARRRGRAEGPRSVDDVLRCMTEAKTARAGLCASEARHRDRRQETPGRPYVARGFRSADTAQGHRKTGAERAKNGSHITSRSRPARAVWRRKADRSGSDQLR
jgi:hypothetical protein